MTRRLIIVIVVFAALCALAGWITYRSAHEDTVAHRGTTVVGPAATVGTVYEGGAGDVAPRTVTVRTPLGVLHLAVYRDYGSVTTTGDGQAVSAPRGGSFVGVGADIDQDASTVPGVTYQFDSSARTFTVAVVTGGRRYPLHDTSGARPVAVTGDASRVSLEVTWDGITQRVDADTGTVDQGRAAPLYGTLASATQSCGTASVAAPFAPATVGLPLTCQVAWRRVPWLPRLGWAPTGSAWVVAAVTTRGPLLLTRGGRQWRVLESDSPLTVRCGTTAARTVIQPADTEPSPYAPAGHRLNGTSYFACAAPATGAVHVPVSITESTPYVSGPGGQSAPARFAWSATLSSR